MEAVGRKGRETSPSEPIRGTEWSHSLRGRCGGRGRVRCLVRKVPYQAKRVQRTKEKNKHKLGKGERWNGRGGAEQSRSETIVPRVRSLSRNGKRIHTVWHAIARV